MLKKIQGTIVALLALLLTSCIYVDVKAPLDTDLYTTKLGNKVGKSNAYSILGLVAWGDAGTRAAAIDGGLETINHMDVEYYVILAGLYTRRTTIVYGD